ncbi:MAG: nicotinate (nicotinamide) nucleotide adenylyltransferase [Planctomycetes bacterium]|nr:nicotinate (nicotinamide) nucleotide adenylyltransferase [Planctomycetota bacterium]
MAGPAREPGSAARGDGIAVLGGSFNPPHRTHARLARAALEQLPIAELRVIPAGDHPHKRDRDMAPATHRLAMCRLAFAALPGVIVDDRELRRAGPSFTVDTLDELQREHPGRPLFFLIGSDNLPLLPTWRDHHRLLRLCTVVTYPRLGHPAAAGVLDGLDLDAGERQALLAHRLQFAADGTAASDLRARWRAGERELPELEPAVRDYLGAHGLYR